MNRLDYLVRGIDLLLKGLARLAVLAPAHDVASDLKRKPTTSLRKCIAIHFYALGAGLSLCDNVLRISGSGWVLNPLLFKRRRWGKTTLRRLA